MKTVATKEAVGMVLAHDMTQIIPGKFKGRRFQKGHIVAEEDVPVLLDMGKESLYVIEMTDSVVHEDDAAMRLARAAAGANIQLTGPKEGKVEFRAACRGLLSVDREGLFLLNDSDEVMLACLHGGQMVEEGQLLGGTRVIPLIVEEACVASAECTCLGRTILQVKTLKRAKIGVVTTGSEIFEGRITDSFGPVLKEKFEALGSEMLRQVFTSDDEAMTAAAIVQLQQEGADLIAVTGGMSVDPDDRTPAAIRRAGVDIVVYGAPALPGAMFLLGYLGETPVVGLPGCVMYHKISIFDLVLPRLLAGEKLMRADIKRLALGGQCRNCPDCHFPNCGFGKA